MRDALPPNPLGYPRHGFTCQACGQTVITDVEGPPSTTRTAAATSASAHPACRQAAYRRRAGTTENTPRQHTGGRTRRLTKDTK